MHMVRTIKLSCPTSPQDSATVVYYIYIACVNCMLLRSNNKYSTCKETQHETNLPSICLQALDSHGIIDGPSVFI